MQAVILAAGKGTRMQDLTLDTPKPLLPYKGKSLLEWKIERLPDSVDEVVIVIGYLGDQIKSHLGDSYNSKKITYVWDKEIRGTGYSLWKDNFLVIMGDDIYSEEALKNASLQPWSITVKKVTREQNTDRVEFDTDKNAIAFLSANDYREKYNDDGFGFTGLYNLHTDIFNSPLIQIPDKDEWGLTHTVFATIPNIIIKVLETDSWEQITAPKDLK